MSAPAEDISSSARNSTPARPALARRSRARWIVAALVLLFLIAALLLPLLNIGRYHRTIADSLTRSLGHTVHLGDVNMQIFPLPGLAIHDLTVEEDPSFGAEPLLRAPSVTVFLRLSSLWRQRLEISRINLDNASVNLTRDSSGRWNFASLLTQASRAASAPTAQRRPGPAPRFPYIEFHAARINFKEGNEKKAFSILNTDASVWLADPNRWQIRLEAQPARTDLDLDLADTGIMRLEGSVTRAAALEQLPLNLHAEWSGAELGQVSRLIFGADSGWRGDLRVETDITGDMRNLQLHSRLRVADIHRLEFTPLNTLSMDVRCQAVYHHPQQLLDNLTCLLPTGDGHLLLTGAVATIGHPQPDLALEINHTPVSSVISAIGLLRRALPSDLAATGTINGQFTWNRSADHPAALAGHAVADTIAIHLAGVDQPFTFAALNFTTTHTVEAPQPHRGARHHNKSAQLATPVNPMVPGNIILLEPAPLAAGAPTPMEVSGQFSRSGFSLHFTGESDLARLQPIIGDISQFRALAALEPQGSAQTDVTFSGPWISEAPISDSGISPVAAGAAIPETAISGAALQGWTRLQNAVLKPTWLPEPIEIATATAQFGNQSGNATITWSNVSASVNGIEVRGLASYTPANFFGSTNVAAPPCGDQPDCSAQVNLDFPTLDAAALQSAILGAGRHGELLQAILSRVESAAPPWPALNGTIQVGILTIGDLTLNNARAAIAVRNGHLNILSFDAAALGGTTHATGSVEAASDGPKYALNLSWTGVELPEFAALFPANGSAANATHEKVSTEQWGTGSIDGQMNLTLHGYSNLASTATGDFRWLLDGSWTGTPIPIPEAQTNSKPAPWAAAGTIANQTLILTKGPILGTIAFNRALNLSLTSPNQPPVHITGTLAQPVTGETAPVTATKHPRGARGN